MYNNLMKDYDFYIVPTPIGNLSDITYRAVEILKYVDIIACEDIRVTQKLLNHYDIKTKCISYHKFNEKERINYFLDLLNNGEKIALVSDAGTPLFCDPGAIIVNELRKNNFSITSLAGANAVATFLSQIARDEEDFIFVGFLPKTKTQIESILKIYKSTDIVFYESPNRLLNTLELIGSCRNNNSVAIGRELTKVFEEIITDSAENIINHFKDNPLKGEIVGLIYREKTSDYEINLDEKISVLLNKGFKAKEISTILSELYGLNKNAIYKNIINLQQAS